MTDSETDGHLNVPPFKKHPSFDGLKKLSVFYTTEQERLSRRFKPWQKLAFVEEHEEQQFDLEHVFRRSTSALRTAERKIGLALSSGVWRRDRRRRGLYVHVALGSVLLRAGFVAVVTKDRPWPPVKPGAAV